MSVPEDSTDLRVLTAALHRVTIALIDHRNGPSDPLTAGEYVGHHLAALRLVRVMTELAQSGRWVHAREALGAGAGVDQVAEAMGLTPDELCAGIERWADRQLRGGHIGDAQHAEVLARIGERRS